MLLSNLEGLLVDIKENEFLDMIDYLEKEREKNTLILEKMTDKECVDYLVEQNNKVLENAKQNNIKLLKLSRGEND